jgi:hypothetical protein
MKRREIMGKKTVAVDVDGVLAEYHGWHGVDHIGDPLPGAIDFMKALSEICDVLVYTTRCCEEINKPEKAHLLVNRVRAWLDKHGFEYADIWSGQGKPIAVAYVDDRGVSCRPQENETAFSVALQSVRQLLGQ